MRASCCVPLRASRRPLPFGCEPQLVRQISAASPNCACSLVRRALSACNDVHRGHEPSCPVTDVSAQGAKSRPRARSSLAAPAGGAARGWVGDVADLFERVAAIVRDVERARVVELPRLEVGEVELDRAGARIYDEIEWSRTTPRARPLFVLALGASPRAIGAQRRGARDLAGALTLVSRRAPRSCARRARVGAAGSLGWSPGTSPGISTDRETLRRPPLRSVARVRRPARRCSGSDPAAEPRPRVCSASRRSPRRAAARRSERARPGLDLDHVASGEDRHLRHRPACEGPPRREHELGHRDQRNRFRDIVGRRRRFAGGQPGVVDRVAVRSVNRSADRDERRWPPIAPPRPRPSARVLGRRGFGAATHRPEVGVGSGARTSRPLRRSPDRRHPIVPHVRSSARAPGDAADTARRTPGSPLQALTSLLVAVSASPGSRAHRSLTTPDFARTLAKNSL